MVNDKQPLRSISMASITKKMKAESSMPKLRISSNPEVKALIEELILDRVVVSLTRSVDDILKVSGKKILSAEHLKIALASISI